MNPTNQKSSMIENGKNKRMRYHHTQHQIQEMEALFMECRYPDSDQRKELSRKLGLEPHQVKVWFQNKRSRMKVNHISKLPIIEVAEEAMEELLKKAQMDEPLWLPNIDLGTDFLNQEEYMRRFYRGNAPKLQGIKSEASREKVVITNQINLVEILMDVDRWTSLFSSIVPTARTLNVLSTGVAGSLNGAMQMIYAEFQVPSPQVSTRDCYFIRYCKKINDGMWAVVDVSPDDNSMTRCWKRPSGCVIQEISNEYSKVTWIEHIEADYTLIHDIYKNFVSWGFAFGAKRWISTLNRQFERQASAMTTDLPQNDMCSTLLTNQKGRKILLKLAERMVQSYRSGVTATTIHQWTTLIENGLNINDVRVMIRGSIDDPGIPYGIVLSVSTSFWMPFPPKTVFDFLRDENNRKKWDILSKGGDIQEVAHISTSRETGNYVSVLRVNSQNSAQNNMLILQESITDPTGSLVIYSPTDVASLNVVLCGGHSDYVSLLPAGFVVLPDVSSDSNVGGDGSLFTIAFQLLVNKDSAREISSLYNLMSFTIEKINASLLADNPCSINFM